MAFAVAQAIEVLERTPRTLASLLEGLADAWLTADEGPDTFSPRDVVGHLIHGEETDWIPRVRIMLEHGEARPFAPFDRFAFRHAIRGLPTRDLLRRFEDLRAASLRVLRGLDLRPEQLALRGTHPTLGRVTLAQLLASWVVHDLGHVRQVVRVMARRYQEDVGPWRAFLTILEEEGR